MKKASIGNHVVVPAKAGIQNRVGNSAPLARSCHSREGGDLKCQFPWVPASAGMTSYGNDKIFKITHYFGLLLLLPLIYLAGCRGYPSELPPVHPQRNMFIQEKGKPYRVSDFFDDGQYMRMPVEGTIARGQLKSDELYYFGLVNNKPAQSFPKELVMDMKFLKRGQQLFNRICAACHAQAGDGEGLVGRRLLVKPASLHQKRLYGEPPGHYFKVITDGYGTMQSLGYMIAPKDRWAVVAYIRALQMSQDMDGAWIQESASWWRQK